MRMMMLFNHLQRNETPPPVAKPDGFWVTQEQKSTAYRILRDRFATQADMEKRAKKILAESRFTKVAYRLSSNGKSGAIIFD